MASGGILREVRRLIQYPSGCPVSDRELLERFCEHHDQTAFAELVRVELLSVFCAAITRETC
jgi:hypothetical protein